MSMNADRNSAWEKRKWTTAIAVITIGLGVIGLIVMSFVSYFQTAIAFAPLADTSIPIVGGWIPYFLAFVFQYGQNIALFLKSRYATGQHVFTFLFWDVDDKTLYNAAFGFCAILDAGTNCIWLSENTQVSSQKWYFQLVEYGAMVGVVWVEEVLGMAIQAFASSVTELNQIMVRERGRGGSKPNNNKPQESRPQFHPDERSHRPEPTFRPVGKPDKNLPWQN